MHVPSIMPHTDHCCHYCVPAMYVMGNKIEIESLSLSLSLSLLLLLPLPLSLSWSHISHAVSWLGAVVDQTSLGLGRSKEERRQSRQVTEMEPGWYAIVVVALGHLSRVWSKIKLHFSERGIVTLLWFPRSIGAFLRFKSCYQENANNSYKFTMASPPCKINACSMEAIHINGMNDPCWQLDYGWKLEHSAVDSCPAS